MNIRFEYLYRDAGNYKQWGDVVFSNKTCLARNSTINAITAHLIDHTHFVAEELLVPDLHFPDTITDIDHDWHEYHDCVETNDPVTDNTKRDIADFISDILKRNYARLG